MSIFIAHSRTPGSKNGVRKYQNEDGTWTEEGLERRRAEYAESRGRKIGRGVAAGAGGAVAVAGVTGGVLAAVSKKDRKGRIDRALFKTGKEGKEKPSPAETISRNSSAAIDAGKSMADAIGKDDRRPYMNDLSNEQLTKMINRLRLERDYANLSKESVEKGKDWLTPTLAVAGGVAALAGSAASIMTAIWTIKGKGK